MEGRLRHGTGDTGEGEIEEEVEFHLLPWFQVALVGASLSEGLCT